MLLGAGSTQETRGLAQKWGPLLRGYFNSAFQFLVAVGTRSQGNELRGNSWLVISSKAELAAWPTHVGCTREERTELTSRFRSGVTGRTGHCFSYTERGGKRSRIGEKGKQDLNIFKLKVT